MKSSSVKKSNTWNFDRDHIIIKKIMQLKPKLVINSSEKILNFIIFILPIDVHRYRENGSKNTCTIQYSFMYIFMTLSKLVPPHIFVWLVNFVFCSHPNLSLRNQWQVSNYIKHFITYRIEFIETNEKKCSNGYDGSKYCKNK